MGLAGSAPQQEPRSTAAQAAANQRRAPINELADLRRFMDQQLPKAQRYRDYRQMLDKQKDLDGIVVATPDHMHAIIASSAMDMGKHVYVQKPLCWSVQEARHLAQKAKTTKVVTQMGNQGHSMDEARLGYEYITVGRNWRGPRGPRVDQPAARDTGRRACRGRRRCPIRSSGGTAKAWTRASPRRSAPAIRPRRICRGTCSSASRRRSITTRSTIHSTGADGSTGARVRSATWERT